MAGETFASVLAALERQVYVDTLFERVGQRRVLTEFAQRHDFVGGKTLNFSFITPFTAADVQVGNDENVPTVYTAMSDATATMDISEYYVAAYLSRFEQEVGPVRDPNQIVQGMIDALLDKIETDLLTTTINAAHTAGDTVGTAGTTVASIAELVSARAKMNPYPQNAQAWVLNATAETALLGDTNLQSAAIYGGSSTIGTGQVPRLLGLPVDVDSFLPAQKSLLVGASTLHWAVAGGGPSFDIVYDPDARADKVVARIAAGVQYVKLNNSKSVEILHT